MFNIQVDFLHDCLIGVFRMLKYMKFIENSFQKE